MKFVEMDDRFPLSAQLATNEVPVILVNKFNVKPEDAEHLIKAWAADAEFFKRQPGFVSAQLHRGIGGSCVFLNYAVWESTDHFKRAFNNPEFQSKLSAYPRALSHRHTFSRRLQFRESVVAD